MKDPAKEEKAAWRESSPPLKIDLDNPESPGHRGLMDAVGTMTKETHP